MPTLILDAILRVELVRPFYPQARLEADIPVVTPPLRVRQVVDCTSLAMLNLSALVTPRKCSAGKTTCATYGCG